MFFGYKIADALYLILDATEHDALSAFSTMMLKFVLPVITRRLEAQLCTHQL